MKSEYVWPAVAAVFIFAGVWLVLNWEPPSPKADAPSSAEPDPRIGSCLSLAKLNGVLPGRTIAVEEESRVEDIRNTVVLVHDVLEPVLGGAALSMSFGKLECAASTGRTPLPTVEPALE